MGFKVYVDGEYHLAEDRPEGTARAAAEGYWRDAVKRGLASAGDVERIIVEHDLGPGLDSTATWLTDENGPPFARFDVRVVEVRCTADEVHPDA